MMHKLFRERILRNPLGFVVRTLHKLTIGRMKYGRGNDYDAEQYWTDRFNKFGGSLRGPGYDGMSEKANQDMYAEATAVFSSFCAEQKVTFINRRVLEIGCGTGCYTDVISRTGQPVAYTGIDITDVQFPALRRRYPSFNFIKRDVTTPGQHLGTFDVIIMIDVLEHIVNNDRFDAAIANIKSWLAPGGVFIVGPLASSSRRGEFFYVRWWSVRDVQEAFRDYQFSVARPFRTESIASVSAPVVDQPS